MTKFIFTLLTLVIVNCLQAQPPTITSFSPASGSIGSLVSITGTNLSNPTALTIGGVSALPISNTGTSLVVMVMPGAVAGVVAVTTAGGSVSSSSNFIVVASLPPNAQMGNKLVGTGNIGAAWQGEAVALSADGNTAVIGGVRDNSNQGAVWIYAKTGNAWSQQGNKLVGSGNTGAAYQGSCVAISGDGNTIIVGGPNDNSSRGAAWIFVRSGSTWTQQGIKLIGLDNVYDQGSSVSISADGNTAIIGANNSSYGNGAAMIFVRTGTTWAQQGGKLAGTGIGTSSGFSVGLSADGNTAIVGSPSLNSAAIFKRTSNVWTQESVLTGTGGIGTFGSSQGYSVALSANGNTAIVGGYMDNNNQGAAWIFTRSGSSWTQQGNKLVGTGNTGPSRQGFSVSLSADGNTAMVGGYNDNSGQGATWLYARNNTTWTQLGAKLLGTGSVGTLVQQGFSVSFSANGNVVIAGGNKDNSSQGAAWIFSTSSLPVSITSFKAFQKNTGIQVDWNTQNETNLNSYEVEISINGSSFTKIGTVIATGLSTYNWFDVNPTNGSNYYRLKMLDKDGSFKYSSIVNVKIGGTKNVFTFAGNPIKNHTLVLQMENVEKGNYAISIFNNLGQQVMSKTIVHQGGSSTQTIELSNVSAGTYQLSIIGSNVKVSKTIVVE